MSAFHILDKVDTTQLTNYLHEIQKIPGIDFQYEGRTYGGWALQSRTGKISDGWKADFRIDDGIRYFEPMNLDVFNKFTPACFGYIKDMLLMLTVQGFKIRRARIMMSPGNTVTSLHQDAPSNFYAFRLNLALNHCPNSYWIYDQSQKFSIQFDGSLYMINVAKPHKVITADPNPRYVLVADIWDLAHKTPFPYINQPTNL